MRAGGKPVAALAFDAHRYRHHVAHMGMTPAQEHDVLDAVWRIMRSFVDRAFGDDPVQLARNAGDTDGTTREVDASVRLDSTEPPIENNNRDLARVFGKVGKGE
jgi:hypothetical protein